LVLLNDPQFVEAARVMAERIQKEGGQQLEDQMVLAFRLSTGRRPEPEEIDVFEDLYQSQYKMFKKNPAKADELLNVGEYRSGHPFDKIKTAALTMVTSTMLNHDESYMKR